jgi:hypothetical protein
VYSPLLAVALIPFSAAATVHVWHVYTALAIAFLVLFAVLVTMTRAPYLQSWRQPVFFGFASFTVLVFMPTEVELSNGQADAFVLVFLAAAVLAAASGWPAASGVLTGVGGLIKTWPVIIALAFFRRGYRGRLQALAGLVATLMVGPVLALATGGISGLIDFFKVTVDARSQQLVSYSVWGMPKILFSRSGLARPLLVSFPLQAAVTFTLAALVVGLLVLGLRRASYPRVAQRLYAVPAATVLDMGIPVACRTPVQRPGRHGGGVARALVAGLVSQTVGFRLADRFFAGVLGAVFCEPRGCRPVDDRRSFPSRQGSTPAGD